MTSVSVSLENEKALRLQFAAQLVEIFDDAIVHDRNAVAGVRMGIALARPPMGGPARVSDPNRAGERCAGKPLLEVLEFAFRAQPRQVPVLKRRNPGGIVAAIFQPLERVDELIGNRLAAENSDYSAH
jgi:hypothetical protein